MSKIIVISLDGTMDSFATQPKHVTHIQNIQGLIGGNEIIREEVKLNKEQGWQVHQFLDKENNKLMVSYYDEGLGSPHLDKNGKIIEWSVRPLEFAKKLVNTFIEAEQAALGCGIVDNVAQAYHFLAQNYEPGDKVYCMGFSRGAYTLRLLTTMIRSIGLINIKSESFHQKYGNDLHQAIAAGFALYKRGVHPDDDSKAIAAGFASYEQGVHPDDNSKAIAFKKQYSYDGKHLIHFLGLFEPVKGWIVEEIPEDDKISSVPKHVRQAFAIDEKRSQFHPKIGTPSIESSMLTTWFAGVHADIGGGYTQATELSHLSLYWMLGEAMRCGLPVNTPLLKRYFPTVDPRATQHNSMHDPVPFTGQTLQWRDISASMERNIVTNAPGETIHHSVYSRLLTEAPQQTDYGLWVTKTYAPANALKAITALQNPTGYPTAQKALLLFNEQIGYKIPKHIPSAFNSGKDLPTGEKRVVVNLGK